MSVVQRLYLTDNPYFGGPGAPKPIGGPHIFQGGPPNGGPPTFLGGPRILAPGGPLRKKPMGGGAYFSPSTFFSCVFEFYFFNLLSYWGERLKKTGASEVILGLVERKST